MISKLAIVYEIQIDIDFKTYVFIGRTFDLLKTKDEVLHKLRNNIHECKNLQDTFNRLMKQEPEILGLHLRFNSLQGLRPDYYPKNVLPLLMEQLEKSFISTTYQEYKRKGKEYLILNDIKNIEV
ncbi:MAG: hypothetical protein ACI3VR_02410 [Intestinibacter sp.]|uniref:hypothetical protein n=1 Tax=Intestinibacter sp. TaxID=1965304 RepID=UPI003F172672